jgi:acetyl esterase/lipase
VNQFFVEQLAYIARKLDAIQEGRADAAGQQHAAVLLQHADRHHDATSCRSCWWAAAAAASRPGRVLDYRGKPNRQMCSLYLSMMDKPYLQAGYTVIAVRHGSSPRYTLPEAVADVRQAVRYTRRHAEQLGVDADRIGAMGMSAGGHLALMLGTTGDEGKPDAQRDLERVSSRVAAVVALVPPTDLSVMVWESPDTLPAYRNFPALNLPIDEAKQHSPLQHVTPDDAPALVLMGEKDDLVPARHGRWIEEAFQREQVAHKLIVFPEAGHGLEGQETRATVVRETIAWFDQHLNGGK